MRLSDRVKACIPEDGDEPTANVLGRGLKAVKELHADEGHAHEHVLCLAPVGDMKLAVWPKPRPHFLKRSELVSVPQVVQDEA